MNPSKGPSENDEVEKQALRELRKSEHKFELRDIKRRLERSLLGAWGPFDIGESRLVRRQFWLSVITTIVVLSYLIYVFLMDENGYEHSIFVACFLFLTGFYWVAYLHAKYQEDLLKIVECIQDFHQEGERGEEDVAEES